MARARTTQQRKLAAILMADVVGYSRMTAVDEPGTLARFKRHLAGYIRPAIRAAHGRLVKTAGDGLLIEFDSPVNAVRCAIAIRDGAAKRNRTVDPDKQMRFRIGVNFADVVADGDDILGDGVNIAARLQTIAEPGGIVVSQAVVQHVKGKIAIALEDMGDCALKNIPEPVHAYRVAAAHTLEKPLRKPADGKLAIAVLPFANMSGEADQRYFSDGITEDIITELSRFRTISVIARTSSFVYRDQPVDVKQIADALHVQFVVEGSVRRLDNRVRITVQLISAEARRHVWAEKYDVPLSEIFAVQDDVTRRVVSTLVPRIETEELQAARRRPTSDARAYDCYLRGKEFYYTATDAATRAEARRCFEQATALDGDFARAYCYLAAIDNHAAAFQATKPQLQAMREGARQFAMKAVAIDDSDPLCHLSLAWCHLWRGEFEAARMHLDIAARLNPNDADRTVDRGTTLIYLGEPEEAIEVMKAAMRLNPFYPESYLKDLAEAFFAARKYAEMIAIAEKISETSAKFTAWKAAAYAYAGSLPEARAHAEHFVTIVRTTWAGQSEGGVVDVASWLSATCPFRRRQDLEHLLRGLKLAGLDFRGQVSDQVSS